MKPYYEHGGIVLYHGDCREVFPTLAAESVDLVLTDPPFGISQKGVSHSGPNNGTRNFDFFPNDDPASAIALAVEVATLAFPTLAPHASVYWWVGHRQFGALADLYESAGWRTRFLVWEKNCPCPPPPGAGWPSAAELCLYAWRPGRKWTHDGKNFPKSNVIHADSYRYGQSGKLDHPTQKPLATALPLIRASTEPGDLILDPFAGSGTMLRAAKDSGCRAIGMEIEERYCAIAARRLEQEILPCFVE